MKSFIINLCNASDERLLSIIEKTYNWIIDPNNLGHPRRTLVVEIYNDAMLNLVLRRKARADQIVLPTVAT